MQPFCDGVIRRDFLRLGLAGLFGSSLSLPQLLQAEATPPARRPRTAASR